MSSWSWSSTHWSFWAPSRKICREIWPENGRDREWKEYLYICVYRYILYIYTVYTISLSVPVY
jgi:hypothetical protein